MTIGLSRIGGLAAALAVCAALGACNSRDNAAADADSTMTGMADRAGAAVDSAAAGTERAADRTGTALDTATAGGALTTSADWTDTDILAYLDAASNAEITAGKLAQRKATTPAVKAFARQMVADHTELLEAGRSLAKRLSVDVAIATQDEVKDVAQKGQDELQELQNDSAGRDWDDDYIDKQIDAHQAVIDHINDFVNTTQNAALRSALQQALPKIQAHLTKAQSIKNEQLTS